MNDKEIEELYNILDEIVDEIPKENKFLITELDFLRYIKSLKDRIDKALDFIDETCWYPDCNNYSNMCDYEVKELRKILKGKDNG